jgi:hypothetical protein
MNATALLAKTIDGVPVEILTYAKGDGALVFVSDEYAGSVERDADLRTWTAYPLYTEPGENASAGMWEAIRRVIHVHVLSAMKAVLAR